MMMKCETCGAPIRNMQLVLGFRRCYSCLDEERVAIDETKAKVKEAQRQKSQGNVR